ncbi:serine/threonine protein kinase, CMGC, dual-specificity [Rhizina undulata]
MPVRVSQQASQSSHTLTNSGTTTYSLHHRDSPPSSRGDDSSASSISLAEGGQRKRIHKSTRREQRPSVTTNNRGREPSPTKPSSTENNRANAIDARAFLQPPEQAESNVNTFYALGQIAGPKEPLADPFEFSPSVNLEDVHRSIIDSEQLSQFPTPGRGGMAALGAANTTGANQNRRTSPGLTPAAVPTGQSVLRNPSVGKAPTSNTQPSDSSQLRQYRKSSASNLPPSHASTAPRKTMGLTNSDRSPAKGVRRPSQASTAVNSLTPPVPQKNYHATGGYDKSTTVGSTSTRDSKSKSLQLPPRTQPAQSVNPSLTPEQARCASIAPSLQISKSPSVRTSTKSSIPVYNSSSRRISTIPHASGLGARTVSPTDARRLKRLSVMATPPPPPTLPFAAMESTRSTPASPALVVPRKSVTPSSSATTPEPQRKSFSSGLSTTSTNTSARTSTGSLQPKLNQGFGSRLPQMKQQRTPMDREEEIPPVPPLPKNLASPAEFTAPEHAFLFNHDSSRSSRSSSSKNSNHRTGLRKASLPAEQVLFNVNIFTDQSQKLEKVEVMPKPAVKATGEKETRRKRGMTLGGISVGGSGSSHKLESKTSAQSLRKKELVPLRLPPLNLLPLSTPTIARVNALGAHSDSEELTPPPKRAGIKTPSTPMTASKASFFSRREKEEPMPFSRSNSSVNHVSLPPVADSPSSLSLRAGSSASSSIPVSASSRMGRQTSSPYISSSLPKSSTMSDMDAKNIDLKNSRILGMPRDKSRTRKSQDSARSGPPPEEMLPETPNAASSIRRKLSLSWKKSSSSKHSHAATERAEEYQSPSKYDPVPPPKLPSSATWAGPLTNTASPAKVQQPIAPPLQGRRKSSAGILHDRTRSDSWGSNGGSPKKEKTAESVTKPQPPLPPAKMNSTNILSPMSKMLGGKNSSGQMKSGRSQPPTPEHGDPTLDHDDLFAEEEMRKIASRRKNLDAMAIELDELKRRAVPKERMTPPQALRSIALNIFERGEIVDYKEVYFTGTPDAKKHVGDLKSTTLPNFGYDDERGDYQIVKGDHLAYRYEVVDLLGKGSFGQVVRCVDHKTGGLVAVKIIRNKKRFHQQALVEVNILQKLKEWDPHNKHSLINFTQSFYFRGHLCISTELLGMNLYEFIKSNDFRGFSLRLIRRFTKQLLSSLVLLKGKRVIHCDLKPENILLAHPMHSEIKVIDFGSSCFEHEKVYTYIQSRFYRSPEVILGMTYGMPIDMWSLGCILAELYTGYPIFPGENEQEQLACIMEVFGPPEKHLIEKSTRKKLFFDSFGKPRMIVSSKGRRRRPSSKTLQNALKCDDEAFLDFISRCLRWDPDKRIKPDEAMHHDFITGRKSTSRSRGANYSNDIATRRFAGVSYSSSVARPLPDPPAAANSAKTKIGLGATGNASNAGNSSSPMKAGYGTLKRNASTASTTTTVAGVKRNSTGAAVNAAGSNLPRVVNAVVGSSGAGGSGGINSRTISGKIPTPSSSSVGTRASAGTSASIRLVKDEESGTDGSGSRSAGRGGSRR